MGKVFNLKEVEKRVVKRQNNIELLRIVCMLMIITLHFLGHGGVIASYQQVSANLILCELIKGICMVAVNCFILISGYFGVDSHFKLSKVAKLVLQVWTYSVCIFLVLLMFRQTHPGIRDWVYAFFPVSTNMDGFSTIYIMMYILSPFLNRLISSLKMAEFRMLLIVLFIFFVLQNSVLFFMGSTLEYGGGYGIVWFVVLYFTGAYIKRYPHEEISLKKRSLIYITCVVLSLLTCMSAIVCYVVTGIHKFFELKEVFYYYNSVFVYAASVALFGLMLKLKIKTRIGNKVITVLAPLTFGIYLIHDNRFLRSILWKYVRASNLANNPWFIIYMFVCVVVIFMVCGVIEFLRSILFSKIKAVDRIFTRIDQYVHK